MRPAALAHTVIVVQSTSKKETANPQLSAVGTQAHLDDLLRRARAGRCGRRTRRQKVRRGIRSVRVAVPASTQVVSPR